MDGAHHVIAAGEDVSRITAESDRKDALHPLCGVDFTALATVVLEDTDTPVVGPGDELAPRGGIVHIHHSGYKILEVSYHKDLI